MYQYYFVYIRHLNMIYMYICRKKEGNTYLVKVLCLNWCKNTCNLANNGGFGHSHVDV